MELGGWRVCDMWSWFDFAVFECVESSVSGQLLLLSAELVFCGSGIWRLALYPGGITVGALFFWGANCIVGRELGASGRDAWAILRFSRTRGGLGGKVRSVDHPRGSGHPWDPCSGCGYRSLLWLHSRGPRAPGSFGCRFHLLRGGWRRSGEGYVG